MTVQGFQVILIPLEVLVDLVDLGIDAVFKTFQKDTSGGRVQLEASPAPSEVHAESCWSAEFAKIIIFLLFV